MSASSNHAEINNLYSQDYCRQLELAYGRQMMSEGGPNEIDKMFEGIDLKFKHILDFGSGLGGLAIHLASKYNTSVVGIDVNERMVQYASGCIPVHLKSKIAFHTSRENRKLPFNDASFSVICSKGVITHLPQYQRTQIFDEFYRLLSPFGQLIIHDWMSPLQNIWGKNMHDLCDAEGLPLYAHTPENYKSEIAHHGFENIIFIDRTTDYAIYNKEIIDRLNSDLIKNTFIHEFGIKTYKGHIKGYEHIYNAHVSGELISGSIRARKI